MNIAVILLENELEELYNLLIGEFAIICIWLIFSYIIASIVHVVFYQRDRRKKEEKEIFYEKENSQSSLVSYDKEE